MSGAAPPVVSVIVPAYNAAPWLMQTLRAIQAQTFARWEVLVVDDASLDDTPQLVTALAAQDPRFRLLRLTANTGGPAGPRNHALGEARAPWLAFCDADDLWHPEKLALQLQVAQRERADLVCSAILDFADADGAPRHAVLAIDTSDATTAIGLRQLLRKNVIPNSTVLCRRDAALAAGGFDTARGLVAVEDYDLWLRLLERGARVVKMSTPLVLYRRLPGSLSARKFRLARRVLTVLRRHFTRRGQPWLFPLMAPLLMAHYVIQSLYLRVWCGRL
jgi:teichuronic acid biosynthesis glycosyltransferase TuaG